MKKMLAILIICILAAPLFAAPWAREYHSEMKAFVDVLASPAEPDDVDDFGAPTSVRIEITVESMTSTYDRNEAYVLMLKTLEELLADSDYVYSTELLKPYNRLQQHKELKFTQLISEFILSK